MKRKLDGKGIVIGGLFALFMWSRARSDGRAAVRDALGPLGNPPTDDEATQAARELRDYYQGGGRDRTVIASLQRRLGVNDDGRVGPDTTRAVERVGVSIRTVPDSAQAAAAPGQTTVRRA